MSGRAYLFDGADDIIDLDSQIVIADDFTASFWLNFTSVGNANNQVVFGNAGNTTNFYIFVFGAVNATFHFRTGAVSYITTGVASSTLGPNIWNHFVVVRSGTTVTIYQGSLGTTPVSIMTDTDAGNTTNIQFQRFGAQSTGADELDAKIFDLQFFASALDSADRATLNSFGTPVAARVAYYQMQDTNPTTSEDLAGTNDGTKTITDPPFHFFGTDVPHDYNPRRNQQSLSNFIPFNPFGF